MVNPFGNEPDSIFAWKERHKQSEYEKTLLQQRVTQIHSELESIKQLYNELRDTYQTLEDSLSQSKQELLAMHSVAKDRQNQITTFEKSVDIDSVERLKKENTKMKDQLEEYQMRAARGAADPSPRATAATASQGGNYSGVITAVMLNDFDPENPRYKEAYVRLVEAAIREGDILEKIIGILIKYGGNGPMKKIEELVRDSGFKIGIEALIDEKIIKLVDETLYLSNSSDMIVLQNSWDNLDTDELFDQLKKIIEKDPMDDVVIAIGKFRDALQERDIPMSTMLFQIRKLMEGMEKRSMTRTEALKLVNDWHQKIST
ncbi:MAG: hypothetical protein GPJ54_10895 [Candidatus Heimdallarchaeota archaeon]|nr:hypothetical protein [Candidatus Heimdallarchaeota archaeon]